FEIVGPEQIEDDNRHLVIHAERESSRVHYLELLLQGVEIGDVGKPFGSGVRFWVAVVDAIYFGRLQDYFGADFVCAQGGGCVRREVRVSGTAAEDDDAAFLEMPD